MKMRLPLALAGLLAASVPVAASSAAAQTPLPIPVGDTLPSESQLDTTIFRRLAFDTLYLQGVFLHAVSIDYAFPLVALARRTVAQYPSDLSVKRAMVAAFASVSDWSNVLAFQQTVIDADSSAADTAYFRHLFAAYASLGQPARIAETVQHFARRYPRDLRVLRSMYVALGDPAVQDWPTLLTLAPTLLAADSAMADTAYFRHLFTAYSRLGRFDELAALTGRLASQPNPRFPAPAVLRRLGFDALGAVQAWPRVIAAGETLATTDSTVWHDRDYGVTMSMAYTALGQPRRAAAVLARLTTHLPGDASAWLTYADALKRAGLVRRSGDAVARAFAIDRDDARVDDVSTWLWYARELRRAGRLQAARDAVRRAATVAPNDPEVIAARRLVAPRAAAGPRRARRRRRSKG